MQRVSFRVTVFALAVACVSMPQVVHSQNAAGGSIMADFTADVDGVQKKLVALAKAMPADKMSWRPGAGVRSVGEVFLHVASDNYFIPSGMGHAMPASTGIKPNDFASVTAYEKRALSKDQIVAELEQSFTHLRAAMAKSTPASLTAPVSMFGMKSTGQGMWLLTATHLHEHLGQAIAYARMNSVVPPWSK